MITQSTSLRMDAPFLVSIMALIVAIVSVCVAVWQVRRAIKEQRKIVVDQQRHEIYRAVKDLFGLIAFKDVIVATSADAPTTKSLEDRIRELLDEPTTMPAAEIGAIWDAVFGGRKLSDQDRLERLWDVMHDMLDRMRPEHKILWNKAWNSTIHSLLGKDEKASGEFYKLM